jgi:hypothetical protein
MKTLVALAGRVLCALALVSTVGISAVTNSPPSVSGTRAPAGTVQIARMPGVGV